MIPDAHHDAGCYTDAHHDAGSHTHARGLSNATPVDFA